MRLFYTALEQARKEPKQPDEAMEIPEYLAQLIVNERETGTEGCYDKGIEYLKSWLDKGNSTYDLTKYLPVFADFFAYIY